MKNWIKGANATVMALAVIGIFIVLTFFLHSLKGMQIDMTQNKKFTLSDITVTTLKQLDKPVHVIAFTDPGAGVIDRQVEDLLAEYHKLNSKFTYEEVDPKKKPTVAEQYNITQYGTIVFVSNGKTKDVSSDDIFSQGSSNGTYSFSGEEKFTQAIISLTSGEKHKVYFLTGHGELTTQNVAAFKSALEGENYDVNDLNLVRDGKIPDDAETLFVLAPQSDITDKEAALVETYLKGKGKLMFALGLAKDMDKWKNWNTILGIYGVKSLNAVAIETKGTLAQDPRVTVPTYGYHDITSKLSQSDRITVLPEAMALTVDRGDKDYTSTALLQTSDASYGKTNLSVLTSSKQITQNDLKKTDSDIKGPLDLAYAITANGDNNKPRAVIIGNDVFLTDDWIGQQGNKDFIMNSVAWLQEQKNMVTIRPQEESQLQQVMITPRQNNLIFIGVVIVFPLLFLLAGGIVWWRRRKG